MITWRAHYVVGWDPRAATYHVTYVDNNGSASLLHGRIGGQRFVIEAPLEGVGPGKVTWRNECSIAGGPWLLVEEYLCMPLERVSAGRWHSIR